MRAVVAGLVLLLGLAAACSGGSDIVCKRDMVTGSERCQTASTSGGEAAVAAGVAAGAWAVAGCTVNGCEGRYRCNEKTKQCEPIACTKDSDCGGYDCDKGSGRCR